MRSMSYVFGGVPRNLDDCVDHLRHKEKAKEIALELIAKEDLGENRLLKQLKGKFTWKFSSTVIVYEEIYGGCFSHESEERQIESIDNANHRLEACLQQLERLGIDVAHKEARFAYSEIYKQR